MVFGSLVAGSTPQGGGAVAFPVFTKLLEVPAAAARTFSLSIQAVGMGTATVLIVMRRLPVAWRAVRAVAAAASVSFLLSLLAADRGRSVPSVDPARRRDQGRLHRGHRRAGGADHPTPARRPAQLGRRPGRCLAAPVGARRGGRWCLVGPARLGRRRRRLPRPHLAVRCPPRRRRALERGDHGDRLGPRPRHPRTGRRPAAQRRTGGRSAVALAGGRARGRGRCPGRVVARLQGLRPGRCSASS